jgi:hypothetical protein
LIEHGPRATLGPCLTYHHSVEVRSQHQNGQSSGDADANDQSWVGLIFSWTLHSLLLRVLNDCERSGFCPRSCEMLYILDQRLKAQNVTPDKSARVLQDVVRTMFEQSYVEKMFKPQEPYSISATRKVFEHLAHSSIMRLSEAR